MPQPKDLEGPKAETPGERRDRRAGEIASAVELEATKRVNVARTHCSCEHHWSVHDGYGCQRLYCDCTRTDRHGYFDRATRTRVEDFRVDL